MRHSQDETTPIDIESDPSEAELNESVSSGAIYARTSASKPEFHYSLQEQVGQCYDWCEQQGWDVEFVFTDEAETGRDTDRAGMQDLLATAASDAFDIVVFWKLDRLCRSVVDLVNIEEQLSKQGVALQSATEYIDTASPVGRFNFRNLASAAELESDLTSQRVRIGMHGMAQDHRWPNSSPPLGYGLADDQTLEVNEDEAELVRRIFRLYLEHRSMPHVAELLNQGGYETKRGNDWGRWAVKQVLSNELYRGQYQLGEYEEHVEAYRIVSDERYESVTETRYRFQHDKGRMSDVRKAAKATRILDAFRETKNG